jgi:WW domain-containing oxidoreductase
LPELRASAGVRPARGARVVVVSSQSHHGPLALYSPESRQGWVEQVAHCTAGYGMMGGINAYGSSKLANVLFADKLDRRERAHGVRACSLHPGSIIATDIARSANWVFRKAFDFASLFTKSADQGAATTVFCALAPPSQIGGVYFDCCRPGWKTWRATEAAEDVLWEVSETLVEANGGERQGP